MFYICYRRKNSNLIKWIDFYGRVLIIAGMGGIRGHKVNQIRQSQTGFLRDDDENPRNPLDFGKITSSHSSETVPGSPMSPKFWRNNQKVGNSLNCLY